MPVSRNRKGHAKKSKARTLAIKGQQKKFQEKMKEAYMKQMREKQTATQSDVVQNDEVIETITPEINTNLDI